jgi:hypothetical protein
VSRDTLLCWIHPALGFVAVGLAVRAAGLGFGARRASRSAPAARAGHRRLTPWVYGFMLVSWATGLASVELWRDDIEEAASGHYTVGCVIVALLTLAALLSRRVPDDPRARLLHPLVGATAVLLAGVQVFLGLQIMPH